MSLDIFLTRTINGLAGETSWVDWTFLTLSDPHMLWMPASLLGIYWIWLSPREAFIAAPVMTALVGLSDFIGAQLKHLLARPRPCFSIADLHQLQACGKHFSFPSNHAANTAAAAGFLQVLYPRSGWVSWPIVALVGLARVYIGAHYVTDVIGGWIMGGFLGAGVSWLLLHRRPFRQQVLLSSHSIRRSRHHRPIDTFENLSVKGADMTQLDKDILAYSRACERLLSTKVTLNDEETSLVEYYLQELSRKFGVTSHNSAPVQLTQTETA